MKKWEDTTKQEIKAMFGIMIVMGIAKLPELNDYWSKNESFCMPRFSSVTSSTPSPPKR